MTFGKGDRLHDNRRDRVIVLERRVNPMGVLVSPYWIVRNAVTARVSVIREDRLHARRFTTVEDES